MRHVLVFFALASLCACSSSSPPDGSSTPANGTPEKDADPTEPQKVDKVPDGGPPAVGDACAAYAKAFCDRDEACTAHGFVLEWGTKNACVTQKTADCNARKTAPGSKYEASHASACASALPAFACNEWRRGKLPEACTPPAGTAKIGAACADDAQCETGTCLVKAGAACGACAAKPLASDPMTGLPTCSSNLHCPSEMGCVPTSGSGSPLRCRSFVGENASCAGDLTGGACDAGLLCVSYRCVAANPKAAACGPFDGPCDSSLGLVCDIAPGADNKCFEPKLLQKAEKCGDPYFGVCSPGLYCRSLPSVGSVCIEQPTAGQTCSASTGCAAPARCVSGTCVSATPSMCK